MLTQIGVYPNDRGGFDGHPYILRSNMLGQRGGFDGHPYILRNNMLGQRGGPNPMRIYLVLLLIIK